MLEEHMGYCTLTGPAKRNLNMRCIIQAFLLSKAPVHWLLEDGSEPIRCLFAFCSRARKGSIDGQPRYQITLRLALSNPSLI